MTILYDVVSLLRVFPSIGANLEPYSKKENGEKAITSAPNRVLRTGRRIKSVLKHVFRTFARKGNVATLLIHHQRARLPHFNEATCGFLVPRPEGGGSTLRVELRGKTQRRAVLKRRKSFLNFIVIIIIWIEWIKIPSDKYSPYQTNYANGFNLQKPRTELVSTFYLGLTSRSFALETAKAVPPRQGGKRIADRFASFLGAFEKSEARDRDRRLSRERRALLSLTSA